MHGLRHAVLAADSEVPQARPTRSHAGPGPAAGPLQRSIRVRVTRLRNSPAPRPLPQSGRALRGTGSTRLPSGPAGPGRLGCWAGLEADQGGQPPAALSPPLPSRPCRLSVLPTLTSPAAGAAALPERLRRRLPSARLVRAVPAAFRRGRKARHGQGPRLRRGSRGAAQRHPHACPAHPPEPSPAHPLRCRIRKCGWGWGAESAVRSGRRCVGGEGEWRRQRSRASG
jgi:hypothetical protein